MKKLLLAALSCSLLASCTKKTDNYYASSIPAYTITGIQNITLQNENGFNNAPSVAVLDLTVQYQDSTQQTVTLSVSGLPQGVTTDNFSVPTGIPTFNSSLEFYDTSFSTPATPGTYPITITATGSTGAQKTFTFNLTVTAAPSITANIVGKYTNCNYSCNIGANTGYVDSIYVDATVANKIYFHNFMNTGQTVYGTISSYEPSEYYIYIPQQTVGGYSFLPTNSSYYISGGTNSLYFSNVSYTSPSGTSYSYCTLNMFH